MPKVINYKWTEISPSSERKAVAQIAKSENRKPRDLESGRVHLDLHVSEQVVVDSVDECRPGVAERQVPVSPSERAEWVHAVARKGEREREGESARTEQTEQTPATATAARVWVWCWCVGWDSLQWLCAQTGVSCVGEGLTRLRWTQRVTCLRLHWQQTQWKYQLFTQACN